MTETKNSRIQLREVEEADLSVFFQNQLDPEANYMAAFTAKDPADRKAFDSLWAKIRADKSVTIRTIIVGGEVAGSVLSHSWFGFLEVSYWLGRAYWGRGIATEALAAFLEIQSTRPIFGRAANDNVASRRVLEKCGFKLVNIERGFANARGEEIDEVVTKLE